MQEVSKIPRSSELRRLSSACKGTRNMLHAKHAYNHFFLVTFKRSSCIDELIHIRHAPACWGDLPAGSGEQSMIAVYGKGFNNDNVVITGDSPVHTTKKRPGLNGNRSPNSRVRRLVSPSPAAVARKACSPGKKAIGKEKKNRCRSRAWLRFARHKEQGKPTVHGNQRNRCHCTFHAGPPLLDDGRSDPPTFSETPAARHTPQRFRSQVSFNSHTPFDWHVGGVLVRGRVSD